eukprot:361821-Chlamydomonas_euryale.AAC.2
MGVPAAAASAVSCMWRMPRSLKRPGRRRAFAFSTATHVRDFWKRHTRLPAGCQAVFGSSAVELLVRHRPWVLAAVYVARLARPLFTLQVQEARMHAWLSAGGRPKRQPARGRARLCCGTASCMG